MNVEATKKFLINKQAVYVLLALRNPCDRYLLAYYKHTISILYPYYIHTISILYLRINYLCSILKTFWTWQNFKGL